MQPVSILIVEDDPIQSTALKSGLKSLGYGISGEFASGEDALAWLKNNRADIVVMDIDLDGRMSGIEAADKIYETYHIPIIYLTHHEQVSTYYKARLKVPARYVTKPLSIVNILSAIDGIVEDQQKDETGTFKARMGDRIFVKNGTGHYRVLIEDILYIKADGEASLLFHDGPESPSTLSINLARVEKHLAEFEYLVRCSRSHMVNLQPVERVKEAQVVNEATGRKTRKKVLVIKNKEIPIGDKFKSSVMTYFHLR